MRLAPSRQVLSALRRPLVAGPLAGVLAVLVLWAAWRAGGTLLWVGVALAPLLAALWLRPRGGAEPSARLAWLRRAEALLIVVAWVPLACTGVVWTMLREPWPLSLRQGPDTEWAEVQFENRLGYAPPPALSDLHARLAWQGPGESVFSVAFRFDDPAAIEELVRRRRLEPCPPDAVEGLRSLAGPAWWPGRAALGAADEAWRAADGTPRCFVHLWVDRDAGRAWLQDVDVQ